MDLQALFFITQSIYAIAAIIFLTFFIVLLIYIYKTFKSLSQKAEEAIAESYQAASEARNYTAKIGKSLLDYLVVKIFKNIGKD